MPRNGGGIHRCRWLSSGGRLTTVPCRLMAEVLTRGTGARAREFGLRKRAAGKTGTTDDFQDAWFVGLDDRLACGVWLGFDRPQRIFQGATGGELALPIWVDIIEGR